MFHRHQLWQHRGIDAKKVRAFRYAAGGRKRKIVVGDMLAGNGTAGDLLRSLGVDVGAGFVV